jgi:hypothetical protein
MRRIEKLLVYGALLFSLACAVMVIGGYGYTGPVNITVATVNDSRVDPNQTIVWDVGPILNGTSGNYVQNGFGLDFDGVGDYVNVSKSASLNITGAFTVDVWFNVPQESAADNMIIASSRDVGPGFDGWTIGIAQTSGRVRFVLQTSIGAAIQQGAADVADGTYHHAVATWDGVNANLYVDGVLVDGPDAVGGTILKKQTPTLIADDTTGADLPLNGTVDEFRVYNRALGSGESIYSYNYKVPLNQTGLVCWVDFDTNVLDQSGSGNNGVTTGAPEYVIGTRGLAGIVLDGEDDVIAYGGITLVRGTHSINFWYKPTSITSGENAIAGKSNDIFKSYIQQSSNDWLGETNTNGDTFSISNSIPDTNWHNWHFAYNTTLVYWYLDGEFGGTAAGVLDNSLTMNTIGAAGETEPAPRYMMNATVDQFRVFSRQLTPTEIMEHYNGVYSNDTNLILYYDFDGNYLDGSVSGNDGTPGDDPEFSDGWAYTTVLSDLGPGGQSALTNSTTGLMALIQDAPALYGNYTNVNITAVGATQNQTYALFQVDLYNIDVGALYTEVEAGLNTLIYANGSSVLDGHELTDGDSLVINGVTLSWNQYMDRFEGTTTSTIPAIITYDTLTSMLEATYSITNGNITTPVTVVWTTDRITQIIPFLRTGDWPGAIIAINTLLMGQTIFWTFLLTGISVSIYNHSGAEVALLTWMLGWGTFAAVLHSQALTISLVFMAVGGGIYIAKFFLDRRTSI